MTMTYLPYPTYPTYLEEELRRELHLTCGPGVAGRETRIADHAERGASDRSGATRLSEVRLVEQVEDLEAELRARAAGQGHVLDERQVGVAESWSDNRVARQIAEVRDARRVVGQRERRRGRAGAGDARVAHDVAGEPLVADHVAVGVEVRRRDDRRQGPDEVGPHRREPGDRRNVGDDVQRVPALRLLDDDDLPTFLQPVALER